MTTRTRSLPWLLALGLALTLPELTMAGPNEGGTLILHANPTLTFTSDIANYCGMAGLDSCSHAVTSVAWDPGTKTVFYAIAAFPPGSSPRLKGISFGIEYDPTKFVMVASGSCADFELPDGTWPTSGTGTAQTWTAATQTGLLTDVYWFAGYAYAEDEEAPDSTTVELIPHPLHGGKFIDDAFPAQEDTIAGCGRLGFGLPGSLPCPTALGDVIWVPNGDQGDLEVEGNDADPGGPSVGLPTDGEPSEYEPPRDLLVPELAVWIHPGAMAFDENQREALPISQISFMNSALRDALISTDAIEIQKEFPGFGPADTLRRDYRGELIRVPDLSGFYQVRFPSTSSALVAITDLLHTGAVGCAEPVRLARTQTSYSNDPYDSTFCKPWCNQSDAQWHLINHGLIPEGNYCPHSVANSDIGLPDEWWIPGNHWSAPPILVGMVDTGLPEDHPDLNIADIPSALRPSLQSHPNETWCQTHGQAMAGLLAAKTNNSIGVAGVCTNCELIDLESTACSRDSCHVRDSEYCLYLTSDWVPHLNNAKASTEFAGMRIANLEMAGEGYDGTETVTALSALYRQGVLLTAPMGDRSENFVQPTFPANVPFVLGVGGFTDDGRFWDRNTDCWPPEAQKGSSVCPGLDICAPADPPMATTDTTGVFISGSPGPYNWTTSQCSGACAIAAGALGYLMNSFWYYAQDGAAEPTPDDYIGIVEATARPWTPDPRSYSYCSSCPLEDFGRGRLDVAAADYVLRGLWCAGGERSMLWAFGVGWHDPRVVIDSTSIPEYVVSGDTLVRNYTVRATINIPSSGAFGGPAYLAWARPFFWCGGANDNVQTTSCLAYGDPWEPEWGYIYGPERWQLAKWKRLTDCQMTAIDQNTGQTVLVGHNMAHVVKDTQGNDLLVEYVVPPSQFIMAYSVVSTLNLASGVQEPEVGTDGPVIVALQSPADGPIRMEYRLSARSQVRIEVFDVAGRVAMEQDRGLEEPGTHVATWDRSTMQGNRATAGMYWVCIRGNGQTQRRKVVVLR